MNEFPLAGGARFIGASVLRSEDPRLVTGEAQYTGDIRLPRMASAYFVRSTEAHATLTSIDTEAARRAQGVFAVLTAADIDGLPLDHQMEIEGLLRTPQPLLASTKVRFVGEPIAIVVARDRYVAEDAAELVRVSYESLSAVTDPEQARMDGAPLLFEDLGTNVLYERTDVSGDVAGAFAAADRIFSGTYHLNRFVAAPMEGRAVVADYSARKGELTLWCSTQTPHLLRTTVAAVLRFPENRLRIIAPDVGGGFGQKMSTYPEEAALAAAALKVGRPLAWVEDRRENLLAASHAKEQKISLEAAIDGDGRLLALRASHLGDAGAYSINSTSCLIEPYVAARNLPGILRLENFEWHVAAVATNRGPVGPYRAVGSTAGSTARDLFLHRIAHEVGLDPAEFFRRNMIRASDFPYKMSTGQMYDSGSYLESLEGALELAGYEEFRRLQRELRADGRYIGIGLAPYVEATGWGSELAQSQGVPFPSHDNASVSIDPSGEVTVSTSMASQGQGHETVFAQIAADVLGIDISHVRVRQGDTDVAPFGMGTFSSRSTIIGGGTVTLAAREVRAKVLSIAGRLLEASPEDLEIRDEKVVVTGAPQRGLTYPEIASAAFWHPGVRDDEDGQRLEATRFYDPPATFSNGCFVVVVEVDPELGTVRIEKIAGVEDCGRIINPALVEGQVHGAAAQAVGGALLEEMPYDEQGNPLAASFMDYLLPTASDVPSIELEHLETLAAGTVGGVKGMGEGGLMSVPGAIACAVVDALEPFGAAVERLPLSPSRILEIKDQLPAGEVSA